MACASDDTMPARNEPAPVVRMAAALASHHSAATPFGLAARIAKSNSRPRRVHVRVQSTIWSDRPLLTIAHDEWPARPRVAASRHAVLTGVDHGNTRSELS